MVDISRASVTYKEYTKLNTKSVNSRCSHILAGDLLVSSTNASVG